MEVERRGRTIRSVRSVNRIVREELSEQDKVDGEVV
jgi:hypothetical protein